MAPLLAGPGAIRHRARPGLRQRAPRGGDGGAAPRWGPVYVHMHEARLASRRNRWHPAVLEGGANDAGLDRKEPDMKPTRIWMALPLLATLAACGGSQDTG